MTANPNESLPRVTHGVVVLSGYGLRIAVERGHLVVEDGVGSDRRRRIFSRIDRELKRVVVVGHAGTISLDAIRWLHGVGIPLVHVDAGGTLFLVATPAGAATAWQRRAQAQAPDTALGVDLARTLIWAKIDGQVHVLRQIEGSEEAQRYVATCGDRVRRAKTLTEIRQVEPLAARAYWRAWQRVPVRFDKEDAQRRPTHWRYFGTRISPLTNPSPRKAVNPANAVLNYLYAILEAEARIATLAVGLDPLIGLLHTDRLSRDSLACDLMEPVRPAVDRYVLELLGRRTISKEDVFELLDGQCRLLPPLAHELATTAAQWARLLQPFADDLADRIGGTRRQRRGWSRSQIGTRHRRRRGPTGVVRAFEGASGSPEGALATPMARRMRTLHAANKQWERLHGRPDPATFKQEILPELAALTLRQMQAATGLARALCTKIRRGNYVPHPRYWDPLRQAASTRKRDLHA